MSTGELSFGRKFREADGVDARLGLEREDQRRGELGAVDTILEKALVRALVGERVVKLGERQDDEGVELVGFEEGEIATLNSHFDVETMESRGAWALPERETIVGGTVNLAWWMGQEARFVSSLAGDERRKSTLRENPGAVFVWSALAPVFEVLAIPHELRSAKVGKADVDAQEKRWAELDLLLDACEMEMTDALAPFRPRGGWPHMSASERTAARLGLVAAWKQNASAEAAARLRMWSIGGLVDRFYSKARKSTPNSRQVMTKVHWRPLVAYFGGDWLSFLRYLGEEPSASEEIATSLPEPRLYVAGEERAKAAAEAAGVDSAELELMLSSFFGGGDPSSPVERRVEVLKKTWAEVDGLHAAQVPGGQNMWGLLDERDDPFDDRWDGYVFGLHRQLLSPELNEEINGQWGTSVIGRAPDRLVTRILPHAGALDALGPALAFWHTISLAAFGNTEGLTYFDYGLVDIAGKYTDELDAMEALGHPVDRVFFKDLTAAAHRLGEPEGAGGETTSHEVAPGISIELTVSGGQPRGRRSGFEQLRDVVTGHRRAWAAEHLDGYLKARWEADLRGGAEAFNRRLQAKGKPPTVKQVISESKPTIDRWFGGDVGGFLGSIGQKGPAGSPTYERIMPEDVYAFGEAVHRNLGLVEVPEVSDWQDTAAVSAHNAARQHNNYRHYAAANAYEYVQRWEALGRKPEMKEVPGGKGAMKWLNENNLDAAWRQFAKAIDDAIHAAEPVQIRRADSAGTPAPNSATEAEDPKSLDSPSPSQPGKGLFRRLLGR
ncbi:MAG: hypothetical protein JST08_04810 [Actinobacteria bacterium]|nr:hypothetical protein [Actinomycetota bacterium]